VVALETTPDSVTVQVLVADEVSDAGEQLRPAAAMPVGVAVVVVTVPLDPVNAIA
jgi:hypothetical protein